MPRPRQRLPDEWSAEPFAVHAALARGIRVGRLSESDLVVPFAGVRTTRGSVDHIGLLRAHALRAPGDQFVSHTSALLAWGAPLPRRIEGGTALHIATFTESRPRARNAIAHRLDPDRCRVVQIDGLAVTDPATSWALSASILGSADLVAVGDFLITGTHPFDATPPLCTLDELAEAVDRMAGTRGIRRAREALALIRYGSLSRQETFMRLMLVGAGLPEPRLNLRILAGERLVAMVDAAFERYRVAVEFESLLHMDPAKFRRDIRKQQELAAAGWDLHRLTSNEVDPRLGAPASRAAVSRIRRSLRQRGWRS